MPAGCSERVANRRLSIIWFNLYLTAANHTPATAHSWLWTALYFNILKTKQDFWPCNKLYCIGKIYKGWEDEVGWFISLFWLRIYSGPTGNFTTFSWGSSFGAALLSFKEKVLWTQNLYLARVAISNRLTHLWCVYLPLIYRPIGLLLIL